MKNLKEVRAKVGLGLAAGAAAAASLAIALSGSSETTTEVHATPAQMGKIQEVMKLGGVGLVGYQTMIKPLDAESSQLEMQDTLTKVVSQSGPNGQSITAPIPLGESISAESFLDTYTLTPSNTDHGSKVIFVSKFMNEAGNSGESATFINPNTHFFENGEATVQEVEAFFRAPSTVADNLSNFDHDIVNGNTSTRLSFKDNAVVSHWSGSANTDIDYTTTDTFINSLETLTTDLSAPQS